MAYGTGQSLAGGRTRAGEQIAGNLQGTTSALSQLINQQGMDLSNIIGSGGNNIANLLAGYGTADAQTKQALAALLANIATGSASQVAGVPGLPGPTIREFWAGQGDSQRHRQLQHRAAHAGISGRGVRRRYGMG